MINVIPRPRVAVEEEGCYQLPFGALSVQYDGRLGNMRQCVACTLGVMSEEREETDIRFIYTEKVKEEEYVLKISEEGIKIFACDYSGAFYAMVTLKQLIDSENKVTCCKISDKPLYSWRGMHLDESRHFFGAETVKKLIDFMALYKLNRFHWHLTDDQGWRIEIKKHPLLTEIGSKRVGSQLHHWKCLDMSHTPVEGYYTQEEIKQIVAYAKARCVEIIPEIDFPAHSLAAIASYNDLACREIHCEVPNFFGEVIPASRGEKNWNRTLCLGKDEVIDFVFDVIDETAELFPFPYFHVGGDEAPTNEWKNCDKCQSRMRAEGLKNETQLQGWFTNKVNAHLKEIGKTMIGWNEILAAKGIDSDIVAQYWTPLKDKNVNKHLKNGGQTILSNHKYFYFDMTHEYCTVKGTYYYEPKKVGIKGKYSDSILGVEGENWTEWTDEENELFFKLCNRGLALSECAWSRSHNYGDFLERLEANKEMLDKMGIYYGEDWLTLEKNKKRKKKAAKKIGLDKKAYDSEYEISINK